MSSKSLKNIIRLVEGASNSLPVEQSFVNDLSYTIECIDKKNKRIPSKTFKPSSIGSCKRNIYFQLTGAKQDEGRSSYTLIGICESGTDRHIRLQEAICSMKDFGIDCEFIDIADFVKYRNLTDIEIIEKSGIETKCYNKRYNISFLTDGIIRYCGKYYILEIKTEMAHKYYEHKNVRPEHIPQGVTYYLSFGIPDVLYLYENRDSLDKKAFHFVATEEAANDIISVINEVSNDVKNDIIPNKEENKHKCAYCKYTEVCGGL